MPEIRFAMSGTSFGSFGMVWFSNLMCNLKITKPNLTKPNQNELKLIPDIENIISGNFYPWKFFDLRSKLTNLPNQTIPNQTNWAGILTRHRKSNFWQLLPLKVFWSKASFHWINSFSEKLSGKKTIFSVFEGLRIKMTILDIMYPNLHNFSYVFCFLKKIVRV